MLKDLGPYSEHGSSPFFLLDLGLKFFSSQFYAKSNSEHVSSKKSKSKRAKTKQKVAQVSIHLFWWLGA